LSGADYSSPSDQRGHFPDVDPLRRVWLFSMAVGVGIVAILFTYVNIVNWHGGAPLGYDSYYYVGFINSVVSSGPLQFAASQHYVEFLYPIVASIPVYLGASADSVEIVLPVVMACTLVVAVGILAREACDWRVAILSVAFSSGWYAAYSMVADFHANLLAFPLLLLASALLVRAARKGGVTGPVLGAFLVLVVLAGAAHVETTDFFIAAWFAALVLLGWKTSSRSWRWSSFMILTGALAAAPFTFAYFQPIAAGGLGAQYCVYLPYWLKVFGPGAGLAILGIGVAAWRTKLGAPEGGFTSLLLSWSLLAVAIGIPGYVTQFPISISDRSLLLLPQPLVSSIGTCWLLGQFPKVERFSQPRLYMILAVVVPLVTAPLVFSYIAPAFRFFAVHGPSLVTCASK